jgi:MoaA/NifB/PqqE/SkfB family radical SAM enzyme
MPRGSSVFIDEGLARSILSQAAELGATRSTFSGGEALLHPGVVQLIKYATELGLQPSLFTNGLLLDDQMLLDVREIPFHSIQISLYAMNDIIHDAVTGVPGSFVKTMSAIQRGLDVGLPISIATSVMKTNRDHAFDVLEWANMKGIPNCPNFSLFGSIESNRNMVEQLDENDLRLLFEQTMEEKTSLAYVWGKRQDSAVKEFLPFGILHSSIAVGADGHAYPMFGWRHSLGDLRYFKLGEIWQGNDFLEKLRAYSSNEIPACKACQNKAYCLYCPIDHAQNGEIKPDKVNLSICRHFELMKEFILERELRHKSDH